MDPLEKAFIERIQVDEGFLDGLDLRFARGLTVIIGARGTGKTSILELVKFCLDSGSFTEQAGQRGHQQALSILGGGQVTVTLSDGHDRTTVVRSATDSSPRSTSDTPDVTVLAQGEIEAVGVQSDGRMHLVDRLEPERRDFDRKSKGLRAEIESVTNEIRDLLLEVDEMEAAVADSSDIPERLQAALELEATALKSVSATEDDRTQLATLQSRSAQSKVRQGVFERASREVETLDNELARILKRSPLAENWPEAAGEEDMLAPLREKTLVAMRNLGLARDALAEVAKELRSNIGGVALEAINTDQQSREVRKRLDEREEGVGAITRAVEELREKAGQLSALRQRVAEKRALIREQAEHRDALFADLDRLREARFASRRNVADSLSNQLAPNIQVQATRSQRTGPYAEAIACGLRGSGLHYNTLSPRIASSMSPLELIQAVESRDPTPIARAAGLSEQRALAVIEALKSSNPASVVAAPIEDGICLQLLDGAEYKDSENVSIGQRCTTVLPVLLAQHGGILMVDQPEDHLDNSFIVGTVVSAVRDRHAADQLIFVSHNANIPVLGGADMVVVMESDGKRGFVAHSGTLDDASSVEAISDVMEGGVEAFSRRAEFYGTAS